MISNGSSLALSDRFSPPRLLMALRDGVEDGACVQEVKEKCGRVRHFSGKRSHEVAVL